MWQSHLIYTRLPYVTFCPLLVHWLFMNSLSEKRYNYLYSHKAVNSVPSMPAFVSRKCSFGKKGLVYTRLPYAISIKNNCVNIKTTLIKGSFHLSLIINCYIKRKMKQSPLLKPLVSKDFHRRLKLYSLLYFVINGVTVSIYFLLLSVLVSGKYPLLLTCTLKATWVPTLLPSDALHQLYVEICPTVFPYIVTARKDFPRSFKFQLVLQHLEKTYFLKGIKTDPQLSSLPDKIGKTSLPKDILNASLMASSLILPLQIHPICTEGERSEEK